MKKSKTHIWKLMKTLFETEPIMAGRSVKLFINHTYTNTCCFAVSLPPVSNSLIPDRIFAFLLEMTDLTTVYSSLNTDAEGKKWIRYELAFGHGDYDPSASVQRVVENIKVGKKAGVSYPTNLEVINYGEFKWKDGKE